MQHHDASLTTWAHLPRTFLVSGGIKKMLLYDCSIGKPSGANPAISVSFLTGAVNDTLLTDSAFTAMFTKTPYPYLSPALQISVDYRNASGDAFSTGGVLDQKSNVFEIVDFEKGKTVTGKTKMRILAKFSCDMKASPPATNIISITEGIMVFDLVNTF